MAAAKLRDLIAAGGDSIEGPWDGEEAITLMADLDAGATGAMTGGGYPDGIRQILDPYLAGRRGEAAAAYAQLATADQLRKPAMRIASLQDTDEGRRRDRFRSGSPPLAEGSPGDARRSDRHRPPARPPRAALGPLAHPGTRAQNSRKWRRQISASISLRGRCRGQCVFKVQAHFGGGLAEIAGCDGLDDCDVLAAPILNAATVEIAAEFQ